MTDPSADTHLRRPALWIAIGCLLAFSLLAIAVPDQGPIAFDAWITTLVQGLPVPDAVWSFITAAGSALVLVPIGIGLVLVLVVRHRLRTAVIYGLALTGAAVWTGIIKVGVGRPRPEGSPADLGFSFPSGHTLNSTVAYGLLALLVWRSALPVMTRRVAVVALVAIIVLIGLSRIALGVHYPTDVVGGWLAATAVVCLVAAVSEDADAR